MCFVHAYLLIFLLMVMIGRIEPASAMIGTTYPEWTAANVGDDVTLSWSLPQSLIGSGFRIFAVRFNAGTKGSKSIMSVVMNGGNVTVKVNVNRTIKYTGNISTTGVFSLWLKNVQEEDAGRYSCEKPKDNYGHGLVVLQPPSTPNISISSNSTVPGQPVTLECSSSSQSLPSSHPFTLSYTWRMNGGDLQQEHGPNLTHRYVTRHDKVAYSCQAIEAIQDKVIRSNWSRQLRLYGPDQVKFDPDSDTVTVSEGKNINVTCSADCNPPCNVKWLDNSGQPASKSLHKAVINVTGKESETLSYKCDVANSFGKKSRNVFIQIPSSIRNCTSNTGTENGTINIECTVCGYPQADVSFKLRRKSVFMKLNNALPDRYSYVIKHARCSDHGKYDVTASNNVESPDNYYLYLKVKCAPRMQKDNGFIHLKKNKSHVFWSFDMLAYPKPISERLYNLPDNVTRREVKNKLHCQQQTADNLFTCTAVYSGDETPDLGKYVIYFQHVEGDRNISLTLVDGEVGTAALGPLGSPVAVIAAGICSILFVFAAVIFVIGLKRCRKEKEQRQRRFAHYLTPVHSQQGDDADYASIDIEDVSVESTSDTRNDFQDLQPSQHHHIYTAMYPQEGNRRQRCGVVCGCLSVQCTM